MSHCCGYQGGEHAEYLSGDHGRGVVPTSVTVCFDVENGRVPERRNQQEQEQKENRGGAAPYPSNTGT